MFKKRIFFLFKKKGRKKKWNKKNSVIYAYGLEMPCNSVLCLQVIISLSYSRKISHIFSYLALYMDIYWKCVCQFSSIGSCRHEKKMKMCFKITHTRTLHMSGRKKGNWKKIVYMKVNSSYKTWYISDSIFYIR